MAEKELAIIIKVDGLEDLKFTTTETKKLNEENKQKISQSTQAAKVLAAEKGSMAALRAETSLLIQTANKLNLTTKDGQEQFKKLQVQIDQNKQKIRDFDRSLSGSTTLVGEYERGFAGAFKSIGATIVKTGVAIAAIRTGWELFNQTLGQSEVISNRVKQEVEGLKASVGVMTNELVKLSSAASDNNQKFISWGDVFSKIISFGAGILNVLPSVRRYIQGLKDDMNQAQDTAKRVTEETQKLERLQANRIKERAEADKAIAEAKLKAAQGNVSAAEIQKALDIENETLKKEIEYQTQVVKNLQDINKLKESIGQLNNSDRINLAQEEAKLTQLETQSIQRQTELTAKQTELERKSAQEKIDAAKKVKEEKEKADKEYFDSKLLALQEEEKAILEKFDLDQKIIEDTAKSKEEKDKEYFANKLESLQAEERAIEEKFDYEMMLEDEKKRRKQETLEESLNQTSNILNTMASLFEANKQRELSAAGDNAKKREAIERNYAKKQQNISILQAVINTAQSITKIMAQYAPPLAYIFSAIAAVQGAIQIGIIKSQKFAKGGLISGVGTDTSDNIPALLSPGEAVINARALKINDRLTVRGTPLEIANAINTYKGTGRSLIPTPGNKFALGGIPEQSNAVGFDVTSIADQVTRSIRSIPVVMQLGEFHTANGNYVRINTANTI